MRPDPIIEEIHQFRQEYAERFNFDINAIVKDLQYQQALGEHQIVSFSTIRQSF